MDLEGGGGIAQLGEAIQSIIHQGPKITISEFRNSSAVSARLYDYLEKLRVELGVSETTKYKYRVSSFVKYGATFLTVPLISGMLGVGGYLVKKAPYETSIHTALTMLLTLFAKTEIAYLNGGTGLGDLDSELVMSVEWLLIYRFCPYFPISLIAKLNLPNALSYLTCYMLSVGGLCRDLQAVIHQVIDCIINDLSGIPDDSEDKIKSIAKAHLDKFYGWVRGSVSDLSRHCRVVEVIEFIDPQLRAWLKGENYESMEQLVLKFNTKYRDRLDRLRIPFQTFDESDVSQARKDIDRETLLVNGKYVAGTELIPSLDGFLRARFGESEDALAMVASLKDMVVMAASRTSGSGDSYFIVEELYSAEGTLLKPKDQRADNMRTVILYGEKEPGIRVTLNDRYSLFLSKSIESEATQLAGQARALVDFKTSVATFIPFDIAGKGGSGSSISGVAVTEQSEKEARLARLAAFHKRKGREGTCVRVFAMEPELVE